MEGRKQSGSSSSSFTSDLFGSKDSSGSSSSSEIFESIFTPSSKVMGRESVGSEALEKKQESASQAWNSKPGAPDANPRIKEGGSQNPQNRDMSSFYHEQKVQPCHLSSSIYYGGQDVYTNPQSNQSSTQTTFNKDGGEDDGTASRGNWWQGSLYY